MVSYNEGFYKPKLFKVTTVFLKTITGTRATEQNVHSPRWAHPRGVTSLSPQSCLSDESSVTNITVTYITKSLNRAGSVLDLIGLDAVSLIESGSAELSTTVCV